MTVLAPRRCRAITRRLAGSTMLPKPPALSSVIRAFRRGVRPPRSSEVLSWARAHTSASLLANQARDFLRPTDALMIERLLRTGRHETAAQHFCDRFSARCFPLEYVWTGGRGNQLLTVGFDKVEEDSLWQFTVTRRTSGQKKEWIFLPHGI